MKKLIVANWKMHQPPAGWNRPDAPYHATEQADVIVLPSSIDIDACKDAGLIIGAQYGRPEESGAFTGDISMTQLAAHGCRYVLCGHSERRLHHEESDTFIAAQVHAAMAAGLHPILCIGETADQRELKEEQDVIKEQLSLISDLRSPISIAYEPIWAIGTGTSATCNDIAAMHAFIRSLLPSSFQAETRILYGGSVKAENAKDIFALENVDGALVGNASLDIDAFRTIVTSAS